MINNNNNDIDKQNINLDDIKLTPDQIKNLKEGLEHLKDLSKEKSKTLNASSPHTPLGDEDKSNMSSFFEAFPKYGEDKELSGVFDKVKLLSENVTKSNVLDKLLEKEGIVNLLNKFQENCKSKSPIGKEECDTLIKDFFKKYYQEDNNIINKPLGEFGDKTLNEVLNQGVKIIEPLSEALKGAGLSYTSLGGFLTFLFLYRSVVKTNGYFMKKYSPSAGSYENMPLQEKIILERMWIKSHKHFTYIAAPLLVGILYTIKQLAFGPTITFKVESTPSPSVSDPFVRGNVQGDLNKGNASPSMGLLGFFNKLPNIIGKIVIGLTIISLIKHLLNIYSINILDPFYIMIFNIVGIIIISILGINYLLKYLLYLYFNKNKNLRISNKLPKLLYDYIYEIKIIRDIGSKNGINYARFFLLNFFYYLFILILFFISVYFTLQIT